MNNRSLFSGLLVVVVVATTGCGLEDVGPRAKQPKAPMTASGPAQAPPVETPAGTPTESGAGSTSGSTSGSTAESPPVVQAAPGGGAPVAPGPMTVELIGSAALPASLSAWSRASSDAKTATSAYEGEHLYIMVSGGEQPTGGFRVEITDVEVFDGGIVVQATLHRPAPGQMVTMALTYPKAFAKISAWGPGQPAVKVEWK